MQDTWTNSTKIINTYFILVFNSKLSSIILPTNSTSPPWVTVSVTAPVQTELGWGRVSVLECCPVVSDWLAKKGGLHMQKSYILPSSRRGLRMVSGVTSWTRNKIWLVVDGTNTGWKQVMWQTDRQAGTQAGRQVDRQASRQPGIQKSTQTNRIFFYHECFVPDYFWRHFHKHNEMRVHQLQTHRTSSHWSSLQVTDKYTMPQYLEPHRS